MRANKNKIGIVVGGFIGLIHLLWIILVALGWAQSLIDFNFRLHHIDPQFQIMPFDFGSALLLIIIASAVGYVFGFIIGTIWNKVHAQQ